MRRYKLAVLILVILSVFNVAPVLAAPVAAQEVRGACADVAGGGEDVMAVTEKRAEEGEGQNPWYWDQRLTQASSSRGPKSTLVELSSSESSPDSLSTSSGHEGGTLDSSEKPKPLPYASGGTNLPWYSKDGTLHLAKTISPPATSVRTKTNKWVLTTGSGPEIQKEQRPPGGNDLPWYSKDGTLHLAETISPPPTSVRTKTNKWVPTTEIKAASSSPGKIEPVSPPSQITPESSSKIPPSSLPTTEIKSAPSLPESGYLATAESESTSSSPGTFEPASPPSQITPVSSGKIPSSPHQEGYLPTTVVESASSSSGKIEPALPLSQITPESPSRILTLSEHLAKTETKSASPSSGNIEQASPPSQIKPESPPPQITPESSSTIIPSSEQKGYLATTETKSAPPSSGNIKLPPPPSPLRIIPDSPNNIHPWSEQYWQGYIAKTPTNQPSPQSKSFLSKSKSISSNAAKKLVGSVVSKLKFRPRITNMI